MPRFILQFDPTAASQVFQQLQALAVPFAFPRPLFDYFVVELPPQLVAQVASLPGVLRVEADKRMGIFPVAVERELQAMFQAGPLALLSNPAALGFRPDTWPTGESRKVVGAHIADADGITGKGVKVAVLDTGVDGSHFQLLGQMGESMVQGDPLVLDNNGHGSHVASTIAGAQFSHPQGLLQGVAPDAELIHIKVLGYGIGIGDWSEIMAGMQRAAELGAKVVSMSLGGEDNADPEASERRVVRQLTEQGIICCIAAGNSGSAAQTIGSPGSAADALTIGAINKAGQIADFSSRGPTLLNLTKPDACVAEDTWVTTPEGPRQISALSIGDKVLSMTEDSVDFCEVTGVHANGVQPVYKIRTPGYTIEATGDHQILTLGSPTYSPSFVLTPEGCQLVLAARLSKGASQKTVATAALGTYQSVYRRIERADRGTFRHKLDAIGNYLGLSLVPDTHYRERKRDNHGHWNGYTKHHYSLEWKPVAELSKRDRIVVVERLGEEHSTGWITEEFARVVGAFLGDGCLVKAYGNTKGVSLAIPTTDRHRADYDNLLETLFGPVARYDKTLVIYRKEVGELFAALGLDKHAREKDIPSWVWILPANHKHAVLVGLADSDGHTRRGFVELGVASKALAYGARQLALELGLYPSNVVRRTRSTARLEQLNGTKPLTEESEVYELSWRVQGTCHRVDYHSSELPDGARHLLPKGTNVRRIQSIRHVGEKRVYDLTVNPSHNFVANGVVVHNCAPGVDILSGSTGLIALYRAIDGIRFAAISGTSMATPAASGAIALAEELARRRGLTLTTPMVKEALARHYNRAPDNTVGYGLITYPILRQYIDGAF